MPLARTFVLLVLPVTLLLAPARGDVVHLTDGRTIEGETRHTPEGLEVTVKHGRVVIPHDQVKRLEIRETARQTYARLLEALAGDDLEGLLELIEHCAAHELEAEARPLLEEARLRAPDAPRLHAAYQRLDFHLEDGEWVPPEVWYPKNGYVRDRGRWLTAEQARLARASRDLRELRERREDLEREVRRAERALSEEDRALATVERRLGELEAFETALPARVAAAQETLRAREQDLAYAREQHLLARYRYQLWCRTPCGCGQVCAWELRRAALYQDLLGWSGSRVPAAERARNDALAAVQQLLRAQGELPTRMAAARLRVNEAAGKRAAAASALELARIDAEQAAAELARAEQERAAAKAAARAPR